MFKKLAWVLGGLAALIAAVYVLTVVVLKPVSMDLASIGQGKPSLVLAYENFSPTGGAALERLREVRGDYEGKVQFIVADLGTPEGRGFARRHRLIDGQAVLLDGQGAPLGAWMLSENSTAVSQRLEYLGSE